MMYNPMPKSWFLQWYEEAMPRSDKEELWDAYVAGAAAIRQWDSLPKMIPESLILRLPELLESAKEILPGGDVTLEINFDVFQERQRANFVWKVPAHIPATSGTFSEEHGYVPDPNSMSVSDYAEIWYKKHWDLRHSQTPDKLDFLGSFFSVQYDCELHKE